MRRDGRDGRHGASFRVALGWAMDPLKSFSVEPGSRVRLAGIDPAQHGDMERKAAEDEAARCRARLGELQQMLFAGKRHSLLIVLQGSDASGKDGTISHVLGGMNPQGCRAVSFREPTEEEKSHDFLWRAHRVTPARGETVVFNRSYYEGVLIERVHGLVAEKEWAGRYGLIDAFEQGLIAAGTLVLKFFLHISKEEQLRRFKDRLDDPAKRWKISESDYSERERWGDYVPAYEDMLSRCSTEAAPWYVIPADHKWYRNLVVGRILVERLEALKMRFPEPVEDLDKLRKAYHRA
jgi:PPK2 family polyphosphate:nucleotide phosphotransferase